METTKKLWAKSAGGKDIWLHTMGNPKYPKFVLIGGVHGDEPEGSVLVEDFLVKAEKLAADFKACALVIPRYNPDGLEKNERVNGNGVDLNRNFPAKDWSPDFKAPRYYPGAKQASESETQALVSLLTTEKPFLVIHCHTYIPQINYTGEISKKWAQILAKNFKYPVTDNIGYPTPGSLGQFCLYDLKTACVCIELPEEVKKEIAWNLLGESLLEIAKIGLS